MGKTIQGVAKKSKHPSKNRIFERNLHQKYGQKEND